MRSVPAKGQGRAPSKVFVRTVPSLSQVVSGLQWRSWEGFSAGMLSLRGGCRSRVEAGGGGSGWGLGGVMALVVAQSWLPGLCAYVGCVDDGSARSVFYCVRSLDTDPGEVGGGRCLPPNPHFHGLL